MSNTNSAVVAKNVAPATTESPELLALLAQIAKLEEEKAKLVAAAKVIQPTVYCKVGEKGGISLYGMGRFPVTLYAEQWTALLGENPDSLPTNGAAIVKFIATKPTGMQTKADKLAAKVEADERARKARIADAGLTGTVRGGPMPTGVATR